MHDPAGPVPAQGETGSGAPRTEPAVPAHGPSGWGAAGRSLLGFLLGLVVFAVAGSLAGIIKGALPEPIRSDTFYETLIFQVLMAVVAILFMLALGRGKLTSFGLRWPSRIPWLRLIGVTFATEAVVSLAFLPAPMKGPGHFAGDYSLVQTIVGILVIASFCEEVVARGLVLSFLAPLAQRGVRIRRLHLSLPVIVAALFFAAMHIPLLIMGIDPWMGVSILVSAFLLGLIAGFYRERSGSLLPAYVAHMLANVFGMGIGHLLGRAG
jgi:membrane protease YdiL (CAAX protease family)